MDAEAYFSDYGEEFIAHYGIPGMKWGRRKARQAVQRERRHARGYARQAKGTLKTLKKTKGKSLLKKDGRRRLYELDPTLYRYNRSLPGRAEAKIRRGAGKVAKVPLKVGTGFVRKANKGQDKLDRAADAAIKGIRKAGKTVRKANARGNEVLDELSKNGIHIGKRRARNARLRRDFRTATGLNI